MEIKEPRIGFIIAHKHVRGYKSYTEYFIKNILNFYTNPLIIVVDNNSIYKNDIFDGLTKYPEVILLDNNIECKFELGAYQVGIKYLIENDLVNTVDYYVLIQDTFVLKNKYDFNILKNNNVLACPINDWAQDGGANDVAIPVLQSLGMYNNMDKVTFCWCNSFVVSKEKMVALYEILKKIVIKVRWESCASERYLARILWELNNQNNFNIDGDMISIKDKYDCWTVDMYAPISGIHFVKHVQQKNETTKDV